MGPRTPFEFAFVALVMIAGAIINANIFGEMAVLVQVLNRKSAKFQDQVDTANTAMKNISLGPKI